MILYSKSSVILTRPLRYRYSHRGVNQTGSESPFFRKRQVMSLTTFKHFLLDPKNLPQYTLKNFKSFTYDNLVDQRNYSGYNIGLRVYLTLFTLL